MLCTQCMGIRPHLAARGKSLGFSRFAVGTWNIFLSYGGDGPSKLEFVQRRLDSCLVTSGKIGRATGTLLKVRRETQSPFSVSTAILGFLSIFKKNQASSPFESLNSKCLLWFQRDVRPPVQRRLGSRAFSMVSAGDSDISSYCEMKDEPAFKPQQGNTPFFRIRASWCAFHLR